MGRGERTQLCFQGWSRWHRPLHGAPATIHHNRNQLMLDDMPVLVAAARGYRAAAAAAGVVWPERDATHDVPPLELVYRLFDVDHVPEQLTWLQSQGWDSAMLFH